MFKNVDILNALMENKTKAITIVAILLIVVLAWAPWISDEYVLNKVKANSNFKSQHPSGIENSEINVFWLPFGKGVATYEGLWYIPFFGFVI